MAKLVDAADSKSAASNGVLVRFQFWALSTGRSEYSFGLFIFSPKNASRLLCIICIAEIFTFKE
jgi:hypothetical protein